MRKIVFKKLKDYTILTFSIFFGVLFAGLAMILLYIAGIPLGDDLSLIIGLSVWVAIVYLGHKFSVGQSISDIKVEIGNSVNIVIDQIKSLLYLGIVLIIIGAILYFSFKGLIFAYNSFLRQDKWDLMICETVMGNGVECYDNAEVLKGYKSQRECMEAGILLASSRGFECGKNCKESDTFPGATVCDEVCNKNGCND